MTNHWVTERDPMAIWRADLTPLRGDLDKLLEWTKDVLEYGVECALFIPEWAPEVGFEKSNGQSIFECIKSHMSQRNEIDLFHFATSLRRFRVAGTISHFERDGTICDREVTDTGQLLMDLRPEDIEYGPGLFAHRPPLLIAGPIVEHHLHTASAQSKGVFVDFQLYSDIWFPFVYGWLELSGRTGYYFNNTTLSSRHTPRLNRFLSAVRELTVSKGGTWEHVTKYHNRIFVDFFLNDWTIRLDAYPGIPLIEDAKL